MKATKNVPLSYHIPNFVQPINFVIDSTNRIISELRLRSKVEELNSQHHHEEITKLKQALVEERMQTGYWKNLHQRNIEKREHIQKEHNAKVHDLNEKHLKETHKLLEKLEYLEAKLRKREQQLFGKNSEKRTKPKEERKKSKNTKGQQKGKKGHGRRKDFGNLPCKEEISDLQEKEKICQNCQNPYEDMNATADSQVVEVEIKAHVRKIHRKRYQRTCQCQTSSIIKTAPVAPKLIPKSPFGISVWTHFLVEKYWLGTPLNRTLKNLRSVGLYIAPGTIAGGFQYLEKFLRPIYELIVKENTTEKQWNADETRWEVFEELEGKGNFRWYLWVFKSIKTVVFILEPSRGAKVIANHLGNDASGIIGCDRYAAYICFAKTCDGRILLAFCWAHVRRDFLDLFRKYPKHENWAMGWVERIARLYTYNDARLNERKGSEEFKKADSILRQEIEDFKKRADKERKSETLSKPCQHVLNSLNNHWKGLTTFVDHPEINMDNNSSERELRGAVVGRKNYYGSGSIKMAGFAAMMFTIINTLLANRINPRAWLTWFFNECTLKQDSIIGKAENFLPWNLSEEQKKTLKLLEKSPKAPDTS